MAEVLNENGPAGPDGASGRSSDDASRAAVRWRESSAAQRAPPLESSLAHWTIDRKRPSHWNARAEFEGEVYYLKWFFHGRCAQPARREWRSAHALAALEIPTVVPVGWGTHPRGSFLVLRGSPGFPADEWRAQHLDEERLLALAGRLAFHVARLHSAGLCHRDLNVYHVLVHGPSVRIIDVGRVRRFRRRRWVVKDLAALLDSARFEGMPARIARRFLWAYLAHRQIGRRPGDRRALLSAVTTKATRYRRHNEKRGR